MPVFSCTLGACNTSAGTKTTLSIYTGQLCGEWGRICMTGYQPWLSPQETAEAARQQWQAGQAWQTRSFPLWAKIRTLYSSQKKINRSVKSLKSPQMWMVWNFWCPNGDEEDCRRTDDTLLIFSTVSASALTILQHQSSWKQAWVCRSFTTQSSCKWGKIYPSLKALLGLDHVLIHSCILQASLQHCLMQKTWAALEMSMHQQIRSGLQVDFEVHQFFNVMLATKSHVGFLSVADPAWCEFLWKGLIQ